MNMKMLYLMTIILLLYISSVKSDALNVTMDCLPELHCKCGHRRIVCSGLKLRALNDSTISRDSNLGNQTELIFSHNFIEIIPDTAFPDQLLGIHCLDFSFNHIKIIENSAFHSFGNLTKLNLRHNRIRNLTAEVFLGLSQLIDLDLSYNRLHALPENVFSPLKSLEKLRLRYNSLFSLPEAIFQSLVSLEMLDLYSTSLSSLPPNIFDSNHHLENLTISGNSFTKIPKAALTGLPKLKNLDIGDNPLHEIPPHAFAGLNSLEQLIINHIPTLEVIREHAFVNLTHLKYLSCSFNRRLATINRKAFMKDRSAKYATKSLQEVILRQNALKSMTNDTLPWRYIEELDLKENPWHCDCHLLWLSFVPNDQVLCETPASLHKKVIYHMDHKKLVCDKHHDPDVHLSIALIISLFFAGFTAMIIVLCWRFKLLARIRSSYQKQYKQMTPNTFTDRMELDEASGGAL